MSTTTDVLSLFKYDPVADADSTFNITQGLNNNWDKLDAALLLAIAAAGAYNPEESYAVGDYCTYKGKLHKCSTAIPTGETWTEAHWTTTTVAAELAELSSQLSNLAGEKYTKMLADIPQTWDEVWAMPPGIYSWVQLQPITGWQPDDTPSGALRVQLTIHRSSVSGIGDTKTCVLEYVDGATNLTRYFGEGSESTSGTTSDKGRWARIATATRPQEFDLSLAEGVTPINNFKNAYSKDQFGIVRVWFSVHFESIPAKATPVFTLPVGFRPDSVCSFAAILAMNEFYCASVTVGVDGTATVDRGTIGQTGPINLHGYIEFPAA